MRCHSLDILVYGVSVYKAGSIGNFVFDANSKSDGVICFIWFKLSIREVLTRISFVRLSEATPFLLVISVETSSVLL